MVKSLKLYFLESICIYKVSYFDSSIDDHREISPSNQTQQAAVMKLFPLMVVCLSVTSCASVISGNQQKINIAVQCKGMSIPAYCVARNAEGQWRFKTPASIVVNKSRSDLKVTCESGTFGDYSKGSSSTPSLNLLGNIFTGGIVGAAVDYHTSAGLNYPSEIVMSTPLCRLL